MPVTFTTALKKTFKILLPLTLGLFILWLVYRKTDFSEIMQIWKSGVRFDIIGFSLIFGLFANIIRAFRWNLLIEPLGGHPKKSNLVCAVLGNYAVNYAIPRLGEVWRCGAINRYEKISFSKLFGTLLIDRLADTIIVAIIMLVCIALNIPFFQAFLHDNPDVLNAIREKLSSVWLYVGIATIAAVVWFVFVRFRENKLIKKLKELLSNVWEGIKTVWHMKDKWLFLFYTILIWGGYFLYFYICFFAFDFTSDLGWKTGLTTFGVSSVSVAMPVPGGVGAWHFAVSECLEGAGVSMLNAKSFAFIVYLIQNLFIALVGILAIGALPIINKKKK